MGTVLTLLRSRRHPWHPTQSGWALVPAYHLPCGSSSGACFPLESWVPSVPSPGLHGWPHGWCRGSKFWVRTAGESPSVSLPRDKSIPESGSALDLLLSGAPLAPTSVSQGHGHLGRTQDPRSPPPSAQGRCPPPLYYSTQRCVPVPEPSPACTLASKLGRPGRPSP